MSQARIFLEKRAERGRKVSWYQMEEQHPPFHFSLVGSPISCTLSLYRGLKLCVYKTLEICSRYELWGGGNKICSKIWHIHKTATNDPSLELYRDRLLYASVFQKQFDLELKLKVKLGSFWGQGENWWGQNHRKQNRFCYPHPIIRIYFRFLMFLYLHNFRHLYKLNVQGIRLPTSRKWNRE